MKKILRIDPVISSDLVEVFTTFGRKIYIAKNNELTNPTKRNSSFYYVVKGLLAATTNSEKYNRGVIVKLIPENRAYGFTDYSTTDFDKHSVTALRNSVVYVLPYSVMDTLINNKKINIRSFKRYTSICKKVTANNLSIMHSLSSRERLSWLYSSFILSKYGPQLSQNDSLKLTANDIITLLITQHKQERKNLFDEFLNDSLLLKEQTSFKTTDTPDH